MTDSCMDGWVKQDRIERGEVEGVSPAESRELLPPSDWESHPVESA